MVATSPPAVILNLVQEPFLPTGQRPVGRNDGALAFGNGTMERKA